MTFRAQKMKELALYIARAQKDDETFGRIKLAKLMFYCDFEAYGRFGAPITGAVYQKLRWGPAARQYKPIQREMELAGEATEEIADSYGNDQYRLVSLRDPDVSVFEKHEIELVDEMIDLFWGINAAQMSDKSHTEIGWRVVREGERIPYETVFVEPVASSDVIQRARELALEHGWMAAG